MKRNGFGIVANNKPNCGQANIAGSTEATTRKKTAKPANNWATMGQPLIR
ncbi:hypothetical protein K8Q98_00225 [Candidatus Nomurabacteria bacterium]|nr:hypothetical protein [Candidatus Nomurabacteria bacterium]